MLEHKPKMKYNRNRYVGICMPGMPDCTAFHSKRSYGYVSRSKAAHSNMPDAQLSDIFMQHPG